MNMSQYLNKLVCGNNLKITTTWPSNYFDSIITDPPYELGFMGKSWDSSGIAYSVPLWKQLLRISKPGAILLCFGGTRTYHRVVCAIEDSGWEIRDCMMWLYGSGFPKSHNISKAIDKAAGAKRKIVGDNPNCRPNCEGKQTRAMAAPITIQPLTTPATNLAQQWDGYGTALKPAWEPIIVAMKPLDGTFAHNAKKHFVAGLNIDGGRIQHNEPIKTTTRTAKRTGTTLHLNTGKSESWQEGIMASASPQGRWPANLILDEEAGAILDEQTDKASRFFYCAKVSKKERNLGMNESEEKITDDGRKKKIDNPYLRGKTLRQNTHPTVKPLALIKYLCTLLKMPNPNQVILDPFIGSGTTGMACKSLGINFIGIDLSLDYCHIARKRIDAISKEQK